MRDQHASGVPVPGEDVERAGREERTGDLGEEQGGFRRGVAGLEDDGVAGGECGGDLPDRHHHRVVPGCHLADDPDRLTPDPRRVALHVLPRRLALEDARRAREEADLVEHGRHLLTGREGVGLAGVLPFQGDELVGTGLDGIGELEQRLLPLTGCGPPPLPEGRGGRGIRIVDIPGRTHRRRRHDLAGCRVDDVQTALAARIAELTVDEVAQGARRGHVRIPSTGPVGVDAL